MDGKRSALGSKGGPKSKRVGKSENREYIVWERRSTTIMIKKDEGDKANGTH
jgi:hypothetical protein